jgi:hypothetical protein
MGISFALFAVSLVGLLALFVCKYLETARGARTPLTPLRRAGDDFVTKGWEARRERMRRNVQELSSAGWTFCKNATHDAATRLHAALHAVSLRFGEYLKRRGAREKIGNASPYVKNMLEFKRNAEHGRNNAERTRTAENNPPGGTGTASL